MEREHWTNAQAIAEMKACGYVNLDDEWDILGYLERYRPTWQTGTAEAPAEHAKAPHRHTGKKHTHKVKKQKERGEPRKDAGPDHVHGGIYP
jgi:hypothetical protein